MSLSNTQLYKHVDKVVLLLACLFVLLAPADKKIWYDETVSVLCSKGISHSTPAAYSGVNTISNKALEQYNNPAHVFDATVTDNSNSYLYNMALHYFTGIFGNGLNIYVLLSRLFSVLALISFYLLGKKYIPSPFFRSAAIFFLLADPVFLGMSTEIRAYAAGIFFITLSALYLSRFIDENDSPRNLFFAMLFSVCAFLTHFLSVYVLLVYGLLLIVIKGKKLLSRQYILPILVPAALLALFFAFAMAGLSVMNKQNATIAEIQKTDFTYTSVFFNFAKFTANNLKVVLPSFHPSNIIKLVSLLIVVAMGISARKLAGDALQRRHANTLLVLALSGSLFLTALSIAAGHNTPFYNRYFSFAIPFNCLFVAYLLYLLFRQKSALLKYGALAFFLLPVAVLFYKGIGQPGNLKYTHTDIAATIEEKNMTDVVVRESADALLIHSFLPNGYNLNYHIDPAATAFKAYNATESATLPIVRIDN